MADAREQAIMQAALEVFAREGFERATMDDIARKARVAKGTLFYRYNSKDELFINLIRSGLNRLVASVQAETAKVKGSVARLNKAIAIQTELSFEHPDFAKILLSEVWGRQDRQESFRESLRVYLQQLENIISQGIAEGEIRPIDAALLAASIFGMTAAATLHLLLSGQPTGIEETVSQIQDYWLKGIRKETSLVQ